MLFPENLIFGKKKYENVEITKMKKLHYVNQKRQGNQKILDRQSKSYFVIKVITSDETEKQRLIFHMIIL